MTDFTVTVSNEKALAFSAAREEVAEADLVQERFNSAFATDEALFAKVTESELGDLYSKATPEDQAAVDAILKKK